MCSVPTPICGLLTGFTMMSMVLSAFIGFGIFQLVSIFISNPHSKFYSNLSIALVIFVYFIIYHCVSKQYKLRKRDDIVPIHLFAEEFFEKELKRQGRHDKQRSLWEESNNIVQ